MTNADLDVRRMRREEILRRLQLAVRPLRMVCQICNRSASCAEAMADHERGNRHDEIVGYRAHRLTMLETTGYFDHSRWCNICGKESPNPEAFEEHLRGAGHRESVRVENKVWMNRLAIMSLREELLRRGEEIPSWVPGIFLPPRGDVLRGDANGSAGAASAGAGPKLSAVPAAGAAEAGAGNERPIGAVVSGVATEAGCARSAAVAVARTAASTGMADRLGAPAPARTATKSCAPASAQASEDVVDEGDDGDYCMPVDRKLGWITSGVQGVAAISSGIADDLGVVRGKVDELEAMMRERNARDGEVYSTIDTLSAGMQSMAAQNQALEVKVLGAMKSLTSKLDELANRPSGGVLGLPLTATVVLSDGRKA